MKKFYFFNLGCASEATEFKLLLSLANGVETKDFMQADVIIANFCGLSTEAFENIPEKMVFLRNLKKNFKNVEIYVGGCATSVVDLKKRYPFVNGVFGRKRMVEDLKDFLGYNTEGAEEKIISYKNIVQIQSGCMRSCGFCKQAYMDMSLKSRPINFVIEDVKDAINNGHPDVVLFAENSTEYGIDLPGHVGLLGLLEEVVKIEGLKSIDLTGLCVDELALKCNRKLLSFISENDIITTVQLEIQSLIPEVRKAMNLTSSVDEVLEILRKMRNKYILSCIIIGYPGETEDGFSKQMELIKEHNIHYAQINPYDNTPMVYAYNLKQIPKNVVSKRILTMQRVITELREKEVRDLVSTTKQHPVDCMYTSQNKWLVTQHNAFVELGEEVNGKPGDIVKTRILGAKCLIDDTSNNQLLILRGKKV